MARQISMINCVGIFFLFYLFIILTITISSSITNFYLGNSQEEPERRRQQETLIISEFQIQVEKKRDDFSI